MPAQLSLSRHETGVLIVRLAGSWHIGEPTPSEEIVLKEVEGQSQLKGIAFDAKKLTEWDSSLLTFLIKVINQCKKERIRISQKDGINRGT